jgi:hypothetical protein
MSRLLNRSKLKIDRKASGEGYFLDGKWVEPTTSKDFNIRCNIQPLGTAKEQRLILPTGFISQAAQVVLTKTPLRTVDQFSVEEADKTTIDGRKYVAMTVENWSRSGTKAAHYQVLFTRRDQDPKGKL